MAGLRDQLVSIVMPAHNSEKYIKDAIESVLKQTYSRWELLIVDDGSDDSTVRIAELFAQKDTRITVLRLEGRHGPAFARNVGIRDGKGRWLAFLDSDDLWRPNKLSASLAFARNHKSALTFSSFQKLRIQTQQLSRPVPVSPSVSYLQLLKSNQIATSTVVLDRQKLPGFCFREDVFFDDYAAWLEILRSGHTAKSVPHPLSIYRIGEKSFSSNKFKAARGVMVMLQKTESLSLLRRYWYFSNYAARGLWKHLKF